MVRREWIPATPLPGQDPGSHGEVQGLDARSQWYSERHVKRRPCFRSQAASLCAEAQQEPVRELGAGYRRAAGGRPEHPEARVLGRPGEVAERPNLGDPHQVHRPCGDLGRGPAERRRMRPADHDAAESEAGGNPDYGAEIVAVLDPVEANEANRCREPQQFRGIVQRERRKPGCKAVVRNSAGHRVDFVPNYLLDSNPAPASRLDDASPPPIGPVVHQDQFDAVPTVLERREHCVKADDPLGALAAGRSRGTGSAGRPSRGRLPLIADFPLSRPGRQRARRQPAQRPPRRGRRTPNARRSWP